VKKITITTAHKGFNYGTSLQAYANKVYLSNLGYDTEIIWYKDGIVKGRDVRLRKLISMFLRTFWRPKLFKKTFSTYKSSLQKEIGEEAKNAFFDFEKDRLQVKKFSWQSLKKYVRNDNVVACVCGSDQIWNATNIFIDPIYYLKFAPKEKRVAYAPSFGKNEIPKYNRKIIKKYISDFDNLSVREIQGAEIIKDLIGRDVPVVLDPTLLLSRNDWMKAISISENYKRENYILLYFLDNPSSAAMNYVERLIDVYNCNVITIPNKHSEFGKIANCKNVNAGPEEFVDLILNAKFVCTDSFHGTAFSVNFNKPFLTFKRKYGSASDQSSRIISLLERLELQERFISEMEIIENFDFKAEILFENSNALLKNEREKAKDYLTSALTKLEGK
jgi:hypothetical protein